MELSHLSDGVDEGESEGLLEGCKLGEADGKEVGVEEGLRRQRFRGFEMRNGEKLNCLAHIYKTCKKR